MGFEYVRLSLDREVGFVSTSTNNPPARAHPFAARLRILEAFHPHAREFALKRGNPQG